MKRMRPATLSLLIALAATSGASSAAAEPLPGPNASAQTPEARRRADELFRNGNRLYAQGKWAEAEAAFRAAWALNATYDVAANLGHTEYKLGKPREAAEFLSFALRNSPLIGKQEPRELARKRLDEVRTQIGTLHIQIQVDVPGATVLVDGKNVGQAPLDHEVFVDPGTRTVEAELPGYQSARRSVEVAKGTEETVTLSLVKPVPRTASPPPPTKEARGPKTPILVAGGTTAGVSLVMGIIFAGLSKAKANDANAMHVDIQAQGGPAACASASFAAQCNTLHGIRTTEDSFADASLWTFVAAGAVGAGTLVYAFAAPKAARTGALTVVPVASASAGGLSVRGTW